MLSEGNTCAEVLGQIRSMTPSISNVLTKTQSDEDSSKTKTKFGGDALWSTLDDSDTVKCVEAKAVTEWGDLDELITVEEVGAVVNTALEGSIESKEFVSKPNTRD